MAADLDQLRGDNSHCTFVGRKGFVELSHAPTDGWALFQEMDEIS